ncbi:MAG: PIN domain-containing protein [Nitrospirota bacterium]
MELINTLQGLKVCIDTSPFIYFIERHEKYFKLLKTLFTEIHSGNIEAITSTITLLEVLVHPLRANNKSLAERYREILLYSEGLTTFEVFNEISEKASELRAKYSIKTPDAIQIATAIFYGANGFLTNDPVLKKVTSVQILVLDEFIT